MTWLSQLPLLNTASDPRGVMELFPAVWGAAEGLVSPELKTRSEALERLVEMGAPRLSPLVAYLVATRLSDPDISMRVRVVQIVGSLLASEQEGSLSSEPVRRTITAYLGQMRTRIVFDLMQVAEAAPRNEDHIARLLNACPYAGKHLADILLDRDTPLPIRLRSAYFVGKVGYLDAIPALERLLGRLESRLNGQQTMPFAPPSQPDENDLLPVVREALRLLHAP